MANEQAALKVGDRVVSKRFGWLFKVVAVNPDGLLDVFNESANYTYMGCDPSLFTLLPQCKPSTCQPPRKLQPGDLVRLRSGGPAMTVEQVYIEDDDNLESAEVVYWSELDGNVHEVEIATSALQLVENTK